MAEHPSIHHKKQAIRHLHRAADDLAGSIERHKRGEHASALEAAKAAAGHIGQAQAQLSEAARLHAEHERQGSQSPAEASAASGVPRPKAGEGSHWNDPGDEERAPGQSESYGTNADEGRPYERG